jgi:hypothetical protein
MNLAAGHVLRQVGSDRVIVQASVPGFVPAPVTFYHSDAACQSERKLYNVNGGGFAFFAQVVGSSVVYTRLVDPNGLQTEYIRAVEVVGAGEPPTNVGTCTAMEYGFIPVGPVTIVDDPALGSLTAPFSLQ